jgi:GNAT superfamily N-acetyltransferase
MVQKFLIRQVGPGDVEEIVRQRCRMYEDVGERDGAALSAMAASTETYLRQAIPEGSFRAWLAETRDARVVGGGAVQIVPWPTRPGYARPRRAWILNVYTYPEYRRRGVARQVVQTILGWCGQEGFAFVNLHATEAGRPLYQSLGFKDSNEMKLLL